MKQKKCKMCKKEFKSNAHNIKYCSNTCRKQARKQINKKYYNKHRRKEKTRLCRWCKKEFTTTSSTKYCSKKCKLNSRREQSLRSTRKYIKKWGLSFKQNYFANLGNSNLRQNRCKILEKEYKMILAEKKRLGL